MNYLTKKKKKTYYELKIMTSCQLIRLKNLGEEKWDGIMELKILGERKWDGLNQACPNSRQPSFGIISLVQMHSRPNLGSVALGRVWRTTNLRTSNCMSENIDFSFYFYFFRGYISGVAQLRSLYFQWECLGFKSPQS